nr:YcxB family protein [Terribacillus saccharophilus]
MRFEYDLDMGDYKNYLVYHFDNSKRFQNAYRNRLIIGIVFLIVFYWVIFRSYTDLITVMIEVVVILLYVVCSKKFFTYISIERELRKVNSEQFSGHYIANLLEDEIHIEVVRGIKRRQLTIKWRSVTNIGENDWYYFLYHDESVSILPKYHIPDDYQQFINEKLRVK